MKYIIFSIKGMVFSLMMVLFLLGGWTNGKTALALTALASPKPVVNITYYVDAVGGDDTNNGTSQATAWKTLNRIRQTKYGPGNKILLHRGGDWSTQLLYIGNGRDDLETHLPGFSFADSTSVTMTNLRNSNIPQLTYGTIDDVVPLDITGNTIPESMIEFGSYGDPASPNPLVKNVMIQWTTGIYVHDIDAFKNGTEYTTIMQRSMNIVIKDYKTPGIYTDMSNNVRIKNILSETSQEHGLYLCDSSANFIIEDSIFRNNTASGIQSNAAGMNPNAADTVVIKRNKIYGNGISGFNDVRSRNVIFYRNLIVSGGPGAGKAMEVMANSSDNKYYHNVIVSKVSGPAVGMGNALNTFVNNIFYVQNDVLATGGSNVTSDYNSFYAALPSTHIPIFNWSLNFTQWKTVTGEDAHSMVIDPQFVSFDINGDPGTWDLHLKNTSPLIDKGTVISASLGESYTFTGNSPDIGIYEYVPSLVLRGAPANQAIHLSWDVNGTLPANTTWRIVYDGPTGAEPSPITGIISTSRAYSLTGLTNYTRYIVTLSAMVDGSPILSDAVSVMPTDQVVYLPLILK